MSQRITIHKGARVAGPTTALERAHQARLDYIARRDREAREAQSAIEAEAARLADAHIKKSWAKRWLRAHGYAYHPKAGAR